MADLDKKKRDLIVIAGPTASGKTSLAISLCQKMNGEVISADSMQIYKGMNIGTAKPSIEEQQGIRHHLMDFLDPQETFSVADYVELASKTLEDILSRGKQAIMAGGTGLYISSFVDGISFYESPSDTAIREEWQERAQKEGKEAVWQELEKVDPLTAQAVHPNNLVRVIRALEAYFSTGVPLSKQKEISRQNKSNIRPCMIALGFQDRQFLHQRIDQRVDQMMKDGLLEEVREWLSCGYSLTAAQAIGYKELISYFSEEQSLEQAVEQIKVRTRQYAKRQLTWFRRDPRYHWIYVDTCSSKEEIVAQAEQIIWEYKGEI